MIQRTYSLFSLLLALVMVTATTGCKKDDFVNSTMDELDKTATEISDAVKNADDKKAGVAEAQKILDGKKDDLGPKMKELGELRGFQVSEEAMGRMAKSIADDVMKVEGLKIDLMSETMKDAELKTALDKLTSEFTAMVSPT